MKKVKAGICGGAGYTGGELIRILLRHTLVEIDFVQSSSQAGKQICEVHTDLFGETGLKFSPEAGEDIDILFLCWGHGDSAKFLDEKELPPTVKLIDLSQDFRTNQPATNGFIYGLPELNKAAIIKANKIANPGCFATCIQLALLPLAQKKIIDSEIHVSAITGSTGAGQALTPTTHFSWRSNNISVYRAFKHQHLKEIYQSLKGLQPSLNNKINFIPYRGNFSRGILATVYLKSNLSASEAIALFKSYYQIHPFVHISPKNPDLKQVINTNNCVLYLEKHDDTLMIISIIDNLLKGASGQAVQNMNLMFGLDETSGLRLKPVAF